MYLLRCIIKFVLLQTPPKNTTAAAYNNAIYFRNLNWTLKTSLYKIMAINKY